MPGEGLGRPSRVPSLAKKRGSMPAVTYNVSRGELRVFPTIPSMTGTSDSRLRLLLVAIALATLVVFVPGIANDFVDWDVDLNFVTNPHYRRLGWSQVSWMFTATVPHQYIVVTWLTLGLDYVLWGMNPAGYHLTNLALHALNTVVF